MIWAAKTYPMCGETDAERAFHKFAQDADKDGGGRGMLLLSEREGRTFRILVGLPSEGLLHLFPGFEEDL